MLVRITAAPSDGGPAPDAVAAAMDELVDGIVDTSDSDTDWSAVEKVYRLGPDKATTDAERDAVVCSTVATKYVA